MKILHSADWHLGAKNLKLSTAKQSLLKDECLMNVQDLFRRAYRDNFDVVLICGDLFHSKNITQKMISILFKEVQSFSRPVLYIEGNHDCNFTFPENMPNNFVVLNKDNNKFSHMGVNFYSNMNENDVLNQNETNILLLHGHIENSQDNDYININKFLVYPFDYIALGHVHQFKKYKKEGCVFAYCGSLFSNGFDECGDKGYLEVVVENKKIENLHFQPFAKRRYMICECDISGVGDSHDIIERIKESLVQNGVSQKDLVRVVLTGYFDEDTEKSIEIIQNYFNEYFYFEIVDKSNLKLDIEKIKNEKLSFKYEFISLVENSDIDVEEKRKICEIGLEALKGEGLNL